VPRVGPGIRAYQRRRRPGAVPVRAVLGHQRPLKDALRSRLLRVMRENHDLFAETKGGCALWKNRDAVESLLPRKTG